MPSLPLLVSLGLWRLVSTTEDVAPAVFLPVTNLAADRAWRQWGLPLSFPLPCAFAARLEFSGRSRALVCHTPTDPSVVMSSWQQLVRV